MYLQVKTHLPTIMPRKEGPTCCITGCPNSWKKDQVSGYRRSYHRFPNAASKLLPQWLNNNRMHLGLHFKPKTHHRVCSDHFEVCQNGSKKEIPTIFPWLSNNNSSSRTTNNSAPSSLEPTNPSVHMYTRKRKTKLDDCPVPPKKDKKTHDIPVPEGHDYLKTQKAMTLYEKIMHYAESLQRKTKKNIQEDLEVLAQEVQQLEKEKEEMSHWEEQVLKLQSKTLSLDVLEDDKSCVLWTGLPNKDTFLALFKYLSKRLLMLNIWRGQSQFNVEKCHTASLGGTKPRKLNHQEELLMVLVRLKTGMAEKILAHFMGVSQTYISQVFTTYIVLIAQDLKMGCELPAKHVVDEHMSKAWKSFKQVLLIVDCTEILIENATDLQARKHMWSEYKQRQTVKFLVGLGPHLGCTFVSKMWGGRVSDKHITLQSTDLIENLKRNDAMVMGDKGFLVHTELQKMNINVITPAFLPPHRPQFTPKELFKSEDISTVRVHVERLIKRIRDFRIWDRKLPLSMKYLCEQLFTVTAYLTNFQPTIVKEK